MARREPTDVVARDDALPRPRPQAQPEPGAAVLTAERTGSPDPAVADVEAHRPLLLDWHRLRYGPLTLAALAVGVFGLAFVAVALAPPDNRVAAWWPAAGLSVLAVAWAPAPRRVAVVLTILLASAAANVVGGRTPVAALGFGASNAAEAAVVAWWLLRGRRRPRLASLEDVLHLFAATALGALTIGAGVALTVELLTGGDGLVAARTVMASHAAAILILVPLGMRAPRLRHQSPVWERLLQWAAVSAAMLAVFGPEQSLPLSFLPMPLLVWGALRQSTRAVSIQLLLVAVVLVALSRDGGGPFAAELGASSTLTTSLVQAYLLVCCLLLLPLTVSLTQRRVALERVAASERLYRQGFSEALLGMLLLRRCEGPGEDVPDQPAHHHRGGLDVVEVNAVGARLLGAPEDELDGTSWTGRLVEDDRDCLARGVRAMDDGELAGWHGELRLRTDDDVRWVEVALSPLPPEAGEGLFVAQMVDVTARRAAEEHLTAAALQDSLTGLANRVLLRDRIGLALATLPVDAGVAVLFCDLDDFKHVNDTAGHTSGDEVLVEVAERLRALLGPEDVAARLGGDEFVVLRPRTPSPEEAEELAEQILTALAQPQEVGGVPLSVGVSIGIAWGSAASDADDLLRDADAAMYAAKAEGKRRAVVYSDEHRARAMRALRLEKELRTAIDEHQLAVVMQPVVAMSTGGVVAAEALVRWHHPERGVLGPVEWLDVAETAGLMPEIGEWVLEQSCREAVTWPGGDDGVVVHVNVSARQLERPGFVDVVRGALTRTGLPPHRLVLEFTETHLDEVSDALLAELEGLRREGIGLAADDYGTGYSPLTRVIELPLTMVKIDRRFVADMLVDERSRAIVTTLVRLGESLRLDVVAEGVEDVDQAEALRELGCPQGQGYLWARPERPEDFRRRLAAGS